MRFAHFFVDRPIFATVLSIAHPDRRRHRLHDPAGRAVSGDRAADHRGAGELSGRRCADGRRHRRDAAGAADQRRRGHALHVLLLDRRRRHVADHHVQARHRSRQGPGARPEPRRDRDAAPAGGGAAPRRDDAQELARPDDGRAHALAGRVPTTSSTSRTMPATTCATSCCGSTASATSPSSASGSIPCASGSIPRSSPPSA